MLLAEAAQRPFLGRILQLGRQHLFFDQRELNRLADLHGVFLKRDVPVSNIYKPMLDPSYLDDGSFFSELGFNRVESVDYSGDEEPTFTHDLNLQIPAQIAGAYDAIYDGGTIEHVFDVRAVMHNIFLLLKVGGRIIHSSPSTNHVDHGFYMFSPTFFYDYYVANNFLIREMRLFVYSAQHNDEPWAIYDYSPGCIDHLSFGGFDKGKLLGVFVCAVKTEFSTWDKLPQQGMYARRWTDKGSKSSVNVMDQRKISVNPPSSADPIPNKIAEY